MRCGAGSICQPEHERKFIQRVVFPGSLHYHRWVRSVKTRICNETASLDVRRGWRLWGILTVDHTVFVASEIRDGQAEQFIPELSRRNSSHLRFRIRMTLQHARGCRNHFVDANRLDAFVVVRASVEKAGVALDVLQEHLMLRAVR